MGSKCICGCGKSIVVKPHHKWMGLPKYIHGHNKSGGEFKKGAKLSLKTRKKISEALKGHERYKDKSVGRKISNSKKGIATVWGKNHGNWKGDKASYHAIHSWVKTWCGKAHKCEKCNCLDAKRYEWANISREYKREVEDWVQLCPSCHRYADINNLDIVRYVYG